MLSVNRILIFLFIGIFSSSLYAIDVSNFDIKGIKLGMSKSEVLKKISCSNPKIETQFTNTLKGKKLYWTSIECKNDFEEIHVVLTRKNKAYFIQRTKDFDINPSWDKIKKRIINYYGKPTCKADTFSKYIPMKKMCWGGCKIRKHNGTIATCNKSLDIYGNQDIVKNSWSKIVFLLNDNSLSDNQDKWYKEQMELYERYKKEKASNIDF